MEAHDACTYMYIHVQDSLLQKALFLGSSTEFQKTSASAKAQLILHRVTVAHNFFVIARAHWRPTGEGNMGQLHPVVPQPWMKISANAYAWAATVVTAWAANKQTHRLTKCLLIIKAAFHDAMTPQWQRLISAYCHHTRSRFLRCNSKHPYSTWHVTALLNAMM